MSTRNQTTTLPSPTAAMRVIDLDYTITIDKIVVILSLTHYLKGAVESATDVIVINHADFEAWCEENEKLIETFGPYDDPRYYEVPYTDFMRSHVSRDDFKEFIINKKLTSYVW